MFDRTFKPKETEGVCLYGLGGKDIFTTAGEGGKHSVLVHVIGGDGREKVADNSTTTGLRARTKIYDRPDTEITLGPKSENRTSTRSGVNEYDRDQFEFNSYRASIGLFYNANDGFGASAGITFLRQGFYKNLYSFDVQGSLNGLFQLTANTRHRYAIGKVDVGATTSYSNYFHFYRLLGLGNNTGFDQHLYDNKFYNARYRGYTKNAFLERTFFQRSVIRVGPTYENFISSFGDNTYLGTINTRPADVHPNTSAQRLLGLNCVFDLNLRNRPSFAQRGVRVRLQARQLLPTHGRYR